MFDLFGIPIIPESPAVVTVIGSHFTATEIILIISAIGTTVTTIISAFRTAAKTDKVVSAIVGSPEKIGMVDEVSKIHTLTNSTLTETKNELQKARAMNESLREIVLELKGERDKKEVRDAYAATLASAQAPAAAPPPSTGEGKVDAAVIDLMKDKK